MPETADWEIRNISKYVESQLHNEEDGVVLVQRVGQERVVGKTHRLYDVHTEKGRWWVITEPTNLYSQNDFPEIDYALTFHIGIMVRMTQRRHVETDEETRTYTEGAWRRYVAAMEAMNDASDAEDFQAVGVKCREALLAIARENKDADWLGEVSEPPKGDDLKGWMAIFATTLIPDRRQRAYLKDVTERTWDIAVGLQHNTNATPLDADMVLNATEHVISNFILARFNTSGGRPSDANAAVRTVS